VTTEEAYAHVLRITQETARNFAWGIRVLPGPKRRAIAAERHAAPVRGNRAS